MESRDEKYEEISNPRTPRDSNSECITENEEISIDDVTYWDKDLEETIDIVSDQQLVLDSIKSYLETEEKVEKEPQKKEDHWDLWIKAILPQNKEFQIVDDDVISVTESEHRIISIFLILSILLFVPLFICLFAIIGITKEVLVVYYQVPEPSNPFGNNFKH